MLLSIWLGIEVDMETRLGAGLPRIRGVTPSAGNVQTDTGAYLASYSIGTCVAWFIQQLGKKAQLVTAPHAGVMNCRIYTFIPSYAFMA
jgi:hypothetical protein